MAFALSGLVGIALLTVTGRLGALRQGAVAWLHGVGGLFGFHALYFASLARAPPATANLINYTWPLLIVLLSGPLLGLRLTARHAAGAALALVGCAVLLTRGAAFPAGAGLGYALAAASALVWALYSVLAARLRRVPSAALAGFCLAVAALAGAAHAITETTAWPDAAGWSAVLVLGLGPVGAAFVLWDIGMKHGDPRLLGTLAFATPVLSTLLLALSGDGQVGPATLVAALLVAGGGLLTARAGRSDGSRPASIAPP